MMHFVTRNGKEYFIIQTTFEASKVQVPVQININISGLNEQNKHIIHKNASLFLDRVLKATDPKQTPPPPPKKPWWKVW
jgi:hypothetical protein